MYAPTMPRIAPSTASAPAVTALMLRRVDDVAPVAVRVRISPADSLRMRPTVIARITSASSMPAAIAALPKLASLAWLSRLSISTPYCVAMTRAAFSWLADSGVDVSISH